MFIHGSLAEFTVAKEQNVALRTGWFSDRSATYLASGRPVLMEDTGFGDVLGSGPGLYAFRTIDEAIAAVEEVRSDPESASRAARELARGVLRARCRAAADPRRRRHRASASIPFIAGVSR